MRSHHFYTMRRELQLQQFTAGLHGSGVIQNVLHWCIQRWDFAGRALAFLVIPCR